MSTASQHGNHYLETTISTAPPARLRLMLIERAIGLTEILQHRWSETASGDGWDAQALRLNDILTELLAGITGNDSELAKQVSDIYVFLIRLLHQAATQRRAAAMAEMKRVLETEAETWRQVCAHQAGHENRPSETDSRHAPGAGNQPARDVPVTSPAIAAVDIANATPPVGSLNLQG